MIRSIQCLSRLFLGSIFAKKKRKSKADAEARASVCPQDLIFHGLCQIFVRFTLQQLASHQIFVRDRPTRGRESCFKLRKYYLNQTLRISAGEFFPEHFPDTWRNNLTL